MTSSCQGSCLSSIGVHQIRFNANTSKTIQSLKSLQNLFLSHYNECISRKNSVRNVSLFICWCPPLLKSHLHDVLMWEYLALLWKVAFNSNVPTLRPEQTSRTYAKEICTCVWLKTYGFTNYFLKDLIDSYGNVVVPNIRQAITWTNDYLVNGHK